MKKYIHLPKHDILLPTEGLYLTSIGVYTKDKAFVEEKYSGIFGITKTRLVINKNPNKIHYFHICNLSQTIYIKIQRESYKEVKEIWDAIAEATIDEPTVSNNDQEKKMALGEFFRKHHNTTEECKSKITSSDQRIGEDDLSRCHRVDICDKKIKDTLKNKSKIVKTLLKKKAKPSKR